MQFHGLLNKLRGKNRVMQPSRILLASRPPKNTHGAHRHSNNFCYHFKTGKRWHDWKHRVVIVKRFMMLGRASNLAEVAHEKFKPANLAALPAVTVWLLIG